jgi:pre-mRNA-processing factor 6
MFSSESRWGKPPPGYIPGLGRGAGGFTTRSDIGPARSTLPGEYNKKLLISNLYNRNVGLAGSQAQLSAAQKNQTDTDNDLRDYSEGNFNKWNGYEENLFENIEYDEEDREADNMYGLLDHYMDERRKTRKEKKQLENLEKFRNERPTIQQTFSDLKGQLRTLKPEDWDNIPEIGDYTIKKRKIERYVPNTDKNIEKGLLDNQLVNAIDPINFNKLGSETPISSASTGKFGENLNELGQVKNSVLSLVFDKMSDSVSGMKSVNPVGYITEMNSVIKLNSANDIQDIKNAKLLLKNLINTDTKNVAGWIAAARLEELDGKLSQAREIISQAAQNIFDSEDIWLEAARLHPPEQAKIILAKGISHLPNSPKLWLAAGNAEHTKTKKSQILRKALENIPTSVEIWKKLIELENEEEAKLLLSKAVECVPDNVEMWLALARLENYEKARGVLNRARRAIPTNLSIWIHAVKLEEAQNGDNLKKLEELIERANKTLMRHGVNISSEVWHKEAEQCEMSGSIKTCSAILKLAITQSDGKEENLEEKKRKWLELAESSKTIGCIETFRFIYKHLIEIMPQEMDLWIGISEFEKIYGTPQIREKILCDAVEKYQSNVVLWLMYAKHKWLNESINSGKKILEKALKIHPENDQILLAIVKLEREANNNQEAKNILERARNEIDHPKVWMHSVQLFRELNEIEEATRLCDEALKLFPDFPKFWMVAGQLKEENNPENKPEKYEAAVKIYEKGIENNRKNPYLYICLTNLLYNKLKKEGPARKTFEQALKALPNDEKIWAEFVKFEWSCGNYSNANLILSKALKDLPNSGLLWSLSIDFEKPQNKHAKAADALSKQEHSEHIMTSIGKIYMLERNVDKARRWLENAIRVNPNYGDAWIYYYKNEILFGDDEQVQEIVKKCEAANPHHGEIWVSFSKKVENWKSKTKDILIKAAEAVEIE